MAAGMAISLASRRRNSPSLEARPCVAHELPRVGKFAFAEPLLDGGKDERFDQRFEDSVAANGKAIGQMRRGDQVLAVAETVGGEAEARATAADVERGDAQRAADAEALAAGLGYPDPAKQLEVGAGVAAKLVGNLVVEECQLRIGGRFARHDDFRCWRCQGPSCAFAVPIHGLPDELDGGVEAFGDDPAFFVLK